MSKWSGEQLSRDAAPLRQPEVSQDAYRGVRLVQCVEMDPGHALAQQFLALPRRVLDAKLGDRRVVVAQRLQAGGKRRGNSRARHRREALDLSATQNGDDAGHDRHLDAKLACQVIPKQEEANDKPVEQ